MSEISSAIQPVLRAKQDAMRNQIDMALLGKTLDVQKESGDAINEMVKSVVNIQKQLSDGHIDVRV